MSEDVELEQAARSFFQGCAVPALLPEALDCIARAIGARGAMLATPVLTPAMMPISPGLNESSHAFFEEGWFRDASRTKRGAQWAMTNPPGFLCDQDLFSPEELDGLPYYRDFARKHDVPWFAAGLLYGQGGRYIAISFNRRAREGAFTPSEIRRLNRILPALQQAALLSIETAKAHAQGMLASFDLIAKPAFLVDHCAKVFRGNRAADALMGPELTLRQGRLIVQNHGTQGEIDELVAWAVDPHKRPQRNRWPVCIHSASTGAKLLLHAMPIEGVAHDVFRQGSAIIVVERTDDGSSLPADLLRRLFKFTPREAEVAALLAEGLSSAVIGDRLRLSAETVRFYLKIILEKSECHRQVEFVRRVSHLTAFGHSRLR